MILQEFSAGYYLAADTRVEPYPGERAVVSQETYNDLEMFLDPPFFGWVGGVHFELIPEYTVPDDFVAVPKDRPYNAHSDDVLLVAKNNGREVLAVDYL